MRPDYRPPRHRPADAPPQPRQQHTHPRACGRCTAAGEATVATDPTEGLPGMMVPPGGGS